jgi:hypothetical protein
VRHHVLDDLERNALEEMAASSRYFAGVLKSERTWGRLTVRQYGALVAAMSRDAWLVDARVIGGAPVRNQRRDPQTGETLCWFRECPENASEVVGQIGVCAAHRDAAERARSEFLAVAKDAKKGSL